MGRDNQHSAKQQSEWLCVLELDQAAGPRRRHNWARLLVKRTRTQPGADLDKQIATNTRWHNKGVVRVRYDLMPKDTQPGGTLRPFKVPRQAADASDAEKHLRQKLSAQGYTVNGDMTIWRLYVVELEYTPPAKGKPKVGRVYVGQTKLEVVERVKQHKLGPNFKPGYKQYNKQCHRLFKRLRQDLRPAWASKDFYSECDALRAEGRMRLYLEARNYHVDGGTELLNGKPHKCGSLLPKKS
jgi:hypothetical protein